MASIDFGALDRLYNQYLGRGASQDEYGGWSSGAFGATDPAGIEQQIKTSGEAQDYAKRTGGGLYNPGPVESLPGPVSSGGTPAGQVNVNWTPGTPLTMPNLNAAYTTAANASPDARRSALAGAYSTFLTPGHELSDQEWSQYWQNNTRSVDDLIRQIYGSDEAQQARAAGLRQKDPRYETATTGGGGTGLPTTGRTSDDNIILAQIKLWAGMPGADPSLTNDPNYWLRRIKETGGLGADNAQYWINASTGSTAFFRNPGREGGGGGTGGGPWSWPVGGGFSTTMFDDPATAMFQQLVIDRINNLLKNVERPDDTRYRDAALKRVDELMQDPYTSAEENALRARFMDPLTQARDARIRAEKERLGARNIGPSSGLFAEQVINAPERDYQRAVAGAGNDLAVQAIAEKQNRRNSAMQILSNLVGLGTQTRAEDQALADKALTTGAILPDLSERRLQLLLNTLGVSSNQLPSLLSTMTSLMNMNQQGQQFQTQQDYLNSQAWGSIIARILNTPLLGGKGQQQTG